jgi:hypothetical protein
MYLHVYDVVTYITNATKFVCMYNMKRAIYEGSVCAREWIYRLLLQPSLGVSNMHHRRKERMCVSTMRKDLQIHVRVNRMAMYIRKREG